MIVYAMFELSLHSLAVKTESELSSFRAEIEAAVRLVHKKYADHAIATDSDVDVYIMESAGSLGDKEYPPFQR